MATFGGTGLVLLFFMNSYALELNYELSLPVQGTPSECQTVWIQIKTTFCWSSSGFNLFAKGYWQTTKLSTGMQRVITGGGREYIYFTEKITWNEAATYCQSIGGNLAIVDSAKFQHLLVKAFTDEYGSSPFPDDYWTGVFRPLQNEYYYPDCTGVHYKQHLETGWDNSKKCFKIKKDDHVGQRDSCGTNHAFICEKPLPSGYSCSMSEIFAVNSLGTDTLDITACTADCDTDEDCWMIMFTPPYGCVKLTYNTDTLVAGVEASNSPVKILGKFCIEVTIDTSNIVPAVSDDSDTPVINCIATVTLPVEVPLATVSPVITDVSCTASQLVSTEIITSLLPCTTSIVTTIHPTPVCTAETIIVTASYVTQTAPACIQSSCICSSTVETSTACLFSSSIESSSTLPTSSIFTTSSIYTTSSLQTSSSISTEMPASVSLSLLEIAQEISQNLTIDAKSTSKSRRKLVSVYDNRPTSRAVGCLGIVFISVPISLMLLSDLKKICMDFGYYKLTEHTEDMQ